MRKSIPILLSMLFCLGIVMPMLAQSGEEFGMASYYHESFDGNETAYGKIYDKDKFTAAHLQHPLGTKLRVTRLDNNKSVVVTVNDKGPYKRGRIIDLSTAAAKRLDLIEDGVTQVKVEVIDRPKSRKESSDTKTSSTRQGSDERPSSYANTSTSRITAEDERRSAERSEEPTQERSVASTSSKRNTAERRSSDATKSGDSEAQYELVGKEYQKYGLYKISLFKP
ncbi:MAG TPA: septal ring lytic transglycosylase RlpA family protein, partial [Phaeodactylibacter sp.]|nr:septal ring lytic transglycosylase RlpA family protein [Phaeodactylibacter sp.]